MALASKLNPRAAYTDEPINRLTVEQHHDLINRREPTSDDPVELIEGVLILKPPKNRPHTAAARRCQRAITFVLPPGFLYDAEQPLSDSEPEPDGMVRYP